MRRDPHDHGYTIDYATLTKRERRLIAAALYDAAVDVADYPAWYRWSRYGLHWWLRQRAGRVRDGMHATQGTTDNNS